MHCHPASPAETFKNRLQYFVIEDLVASQNSKIFFLKKQKTKLGTFNITLKLNSNDYI